MTGTFAGIREGVARAFARVEDVVYIGLATMLTASALVLLADGGWLFVRAVVEGVAWGAGAGPPRRTD